MRYYFHFLNGDDRLDDDLGIDHADLGQARAEALRAGREMIAESLRQDRPLSDDSAIEITDERGVLVDRVSLVETAFGAGAERRYGRIFDALPQGSVLVTADFVVVDANAAFLCARQSQRAAIAGRSLFEVLSEGPDACDADGVRNLLASLQTVLRTKAAHELPVYRQDIGRRDGGAEPRYWRLINVPVLDGNGAVEFIVHQAEDITGVYPGTRVERREVSPPAPSVLPPAGQAGR